MGIIFGENPVMCWFPWAGGIGAEAKPPVELQPGLVAGEYREHYLAKVVALHQLLQHQNDVPEIVFTKLE